MSAHNYYTMLRTSHHNTATTPPPMISAAYKDSETSHKPHRQKPLNRPIKIAETLTQMMNLQIEATIHKTLKKQPPPTNPSTPSAAAKIAGGDKQDGPTTSPKEDISSKWPELHGSRDWRGLLDPLHPWLRREIVKYGEFAQATYDAFDYDDPSSEYYGSCRYNRGELLNKLGLSGSGYVVTKYVYATSHFDFPRWLEKSRLPDSWSRESNWMGFVAVSDDEETRRIGRRDVVVAWRGTVVPSEWYDNVQHKLEPLGFEDSMVERGFLSIYTSKSEEARYNKSSASEQVMREVKRLVGHYRRRNQEHVSLTITGHSLGGALGLLNAYDAAKNFPNLPISVVSFASPRVGNIAFRDELYRMGVKTLRVSLRQDIVPLMPGVVFNEGLQRFDGVTGALDWVYTHVGVELRLDARSSPYLKRGMNVVGFHMLETYLHLVDGFSGGGEGFRADAKRDFALVNKECDMIVDELRIPPKWYQLENKGLVKNEHGRWVKPKRDPEDVPSPAADEEFGR